MNSETLPIRTLFGSALATSILLSADAQLLVYEGFAYGATGTDQVTDDTDPNYNLLHAQPDGIGDDIDATGLGGTWQDLAGPGSSSDLFLNAGSLSFGDLATSGNHVRGDTNLNNDIFSRPISGSLDGSELWVSFLADKLQDNFGAAEGGLVIGNQPVNNAKVNLDDGSGGLRGFGIAPTSEDSGDWVVYGWDDGGRTVGTGDLNVGTSGGDVRLLIARISFDSGTDGADEFTLFDYNLATSGGTVTDDMANLDQVGDPIEVDVDQTLLDTLTFTRQVNTAWDEIRIGRSLADVLGLQGGEGGDFLLTIAPNASTPGNYDFSWESQEGMLYDLVSATDLATAPDTWAVWDGRADLAATPPSNTLSGIPGGGDPRRFFAVIEKEAPPPPPLLAEDFEAGAPAGWTATDNGAGTAWEVGTPDGAGSFPDTEPTGAANGTQCAGTNITTPYTGSAVATLVTPAFTVPAGGARLDFSQYIDTETPPSGDLGSIRLLNASDDSPLAGGAVATDLEGITETWTSESLALPAVANGLEVKIEFRFESDSDTDVFAGFYIDDVEVVAN